MAIFKANTLLEQIFFKESIDMSIFDMVIITSKNSIRALDSCTKEWVDKPLFAIGEGSANEALSLGGKDVLSLNSKSGFEFAKSLLPYASGKRVLFPRGEDSVSNVDELLKNSSIDITSLVLYKTICKKVEEKPQKNSVIIFSSPSTINCFFENFSWDESYKAVCIGEVSASFLPNYITPIISPLNSMDECMKIAQGIDR